MYTVISAIEARYSFEPEERPLAVGLTQQAIISVMGPASGFYQKWLLVKAAGPGSLIGCGIRHLGDAVGYPFSVVQTGLSGSSWLKGLIDKRARGDVPIAQFDGPDGIPVRVFKAGARKVWHALGLPGVRPESPVD